MSSVYENISNLFNPLTPNRNTQHIFLYNTDKPNLGIVIYNTLIIKS